MGKSRRSEASWIESRQRWQINVQRDGKRKTFTSSIPGRKGKHEAEAKADDWLDAGQPDDIRFDEAWDLFTEHTQKTTGVLNHQDTVSIGKTWLLDTPQKTRLSRKHLSAIRLADLQAIINDAYEAGRAKRTCKNIKNKICMFFRFADDQKWEYNMNPHRIKLPTQAPVNKRQVIQPDQLRVLFTSDTNTRYGREYTAHYIHAFRLLVMIGCRSGELCGLKKEDYDGEMLHIRRSVNRLKVITAGKTDNAQRDILIPERAKAILTEQQEYLARIGIKSDWLFPTLDGEMSSPQHILKHWRTYSAQHGIDCSVHELRHTFISIMNKDMPEALLKNIVGHSAAMDTDAIYGHEVDGDKLRAAKIIDDTFGKYLSKGDGGTH